MLAEVRLAPEAARGRSKNEGEGSNRAGTAVWRELKADGALVGWGLVQSRRRQMSTGQPTSTLFASEAETGCRAIGEGAHS